MLHKNKAYVDASLMDSLPDAMGLFLVLSTFLSKFLSTISFTMHPADRINIEPKRKSEE
jgi:hypothetical protein